MEALIPVTWEDDHGNTQYGDALLEYAIVREEGELFREVTTVFLPEGVPQYQYNQLKKDALDDFHNTAWISGGYYA